MSRISLRQAKIRSLFNSNVDTSMQVRRLYNTCVSSGFPHPHPTTSPGRHRSRRT
jgi:hypothetical protein